MSERYAELVGIGSSVYDTLMVVDRFPTEDTKLEGLETKVQGGGPCTTALVAARKLGISAAYLGTIGKDTFGDYMLEDLRSWGVDVSGVRQLEGVSFHSVVLLNRATGSRTCIWNRGSVPQPTPDDLDNEALSHARVLHLDGHMLNAAVYAAQYCRERGIKVCHDAGGAYPGIERLLKFVDWLIPSEEFAIKVTGEKEPEAAAQALYEAYRPELLVMTQGVRGGMLLDEKGLRRYPSYPVEAVDTNGSGDTFHGAFVAAKLKGLDNDDACRFASAAAAIKCTRLGARQAMATEDEVDRFLAQRGEHLQSWNRE
ncbi:MAG: hypothetical protein IJ240_06715 [Clostridia bacterium]|nr:hypothetical protein [Clostridia bacterium]